MSRFYFPGNQGINTIDIVDKDLKTYSCITGVLSSLLNNSTLSGQRLIKFNWHDKAKKE